MGLKACLFVPAPSHKTPPLVKFHKANRARVLLFVLFHLHQHRRKIKSSKLCELSGRVSPVPHIWLSVIHRKFLRGETLSGRLRHMLRPEWLPVLQTSPLLPPGAGRHASEGHLRVLVPPGSLWHALATHQHLRK